MTIVDIPSLNLSPLNASYIAGLFDGEGCICLAWSTKKYNSKKGQTTVKYSSFQFIFAITNKKYMGLNSVKEQLGFGRITRGSNRDVYDLRITKREEILAVINALLPYIRLKHEQLDYAKHAIQCHLEHGRKTWTAEERELFYQSHLAKLELEKLRPTGLKRGRKPSIPLSERLSDYPKFLKGKKN